MTICAWARAPQSSAVAEIGDPDRGTRRVADDPVYLKGTWYRILTDELFERYGILPEIKMEIDSFEAILRLLPVGPSATLLPKSYLRESLLKDNELIRIDIDELKKTVRTTSLIYPDEQEMSPAAQRFVLQARLYYANIPPFR